MGEIDRNLKAEAQGLQYDMIADRIAAMRPESVLDWGAGWGQMTDRIRSRGVACEAYDYVEGRPAGVRPSDAFPNIEIRHSPEPVELPYENAEFALVLSCGVLEHVSDPEGSLREIRRILAPGGRLLVYNLPNRFSYLERIARHTGRYYHGALEHDRVYTRRSARRIVSEAGFEVESVRRANLLPLSIPDARLNRIAPQVWGASRSLRFVPGLSLLSTTIEVDALNP